MASAKGRRLFLLAVCYGQMVGISGAVVASVIDIESIVGSGPILSLTGLALAIGAWKTRRSRTGLLFGLSAGAMTVAVFLLIFLRRWSPDDAKYPVPLILIGYEYLIAPVALLAAHELRQENATVLPGRHVQFNLRELLLVTTFLAIVFAAIRLAMTGHPLPVTAAPGIVVLIVAVASSLKRRRL